MPDVGRAAPGKNHVQSILFDKDKWTVEKAKAWLKAHSRFADGLDVTENKLRFRQYNPSKKIRYRIKPVGDGISFLFGFVSKREGAREFILKYSPDQPRDAHGRWTNKEIVFTPRPRKKMKMTKRGRQTQRKAPDTNHIHSVLFNKDMWTKRDAQRWLKSHSKYGDSLTESTNRYWFRQYKPDYERFDYRTRTMRRGISMVMAYPKPKKKRTKKMELLTSVFEGTS